MRQAISFVVCLLTIGCSAFRSPELMRDFSGPLPDLRIRKIEYRIMNQQQLAQRLKGSTLDYEFKIFVENIGDAPMGEIFYFSVTGNTADYQDRFYTHHIRVNIVGNVIEPGETLPFIVQVPVEPPPPNVRNYRYPIRFYLNTEGMNNTAGYPTNFIAEKSYRNNIYELSMRIKTY